MNINNFTQFYNIIKQCNLESNSPFNNFIKTVDEYITICSCNNPSLKQQKLNDSKRLYSSIIKGSVSNFISIIKSKTGSINISFFDGGVLISKY